MLPGSMDASICSTISLVRGLSAEVGDGSVIARGDPKTTRMLSLQSPMHPFHLAVGKGLANQLKLLVANHRVFLGDALHGAMELTQTPALAIRCIL